MHASIGINCTANLCKKNSNPLHSSAAYSIYLGGQYQNTLTAHQVLMFQSILVIFKYYCTEICQKEGTLICYCTHSIWPSFQKFRTLQHACSKNPSWAIYNV